MTTPGGTPDAAGETMEHLLVQYRANRDPDTRRRLILHHQRLAHYIAARFSGQGETAEDLVQVATVGLIHGHNRRRG